MQVKLGESVLTIEANKLTITRLLDNRMYSIIVELDGSIEDLMKKSTNIVKLSNDMFKEFSGYY